MPRGFSQSDKGTRKKARKKKPQTTRGPQGLPIQASSPQKKAVRKTTTRPAPAVQPGPVRQIEREQADKFKKTAKYRGAVRAAYKTQPTKTRQQRVKTAKKTSTPEGQAILHTHAAEIARNAVLKAGRARSTGFSDTERKRVDRYKASDDYKDVIRKVSEDRGETAKYEDMTNRQIEAERRKIRDKASLPGTQAGLGFIQAGSIKEPAKGKLRPELDAPEPTAKDRAVKKVVKAAAVAGADPQKVAAGINRSLEKNKSPALNVLEETQRPINAVSGAVEAAVKGESVPKAVKKGLVDNKGPGFQKLLKDAGAPAPVAAIGGFALDVGLDPTTYISFGTVSLARKGATEAAERVAKQAARQGLSKETQVRLARAAYRQHVKKNGGRTPRVQTEPVKASDGPRRMARKIDASVPVVGGSRGVQMKFAGKNVRGVTRASSAIVKGVRAARRKGERFGLNDPIGSEAGREGARGVLRQVRPQVRPKDVDREEYDLLRAELRGGRAARAQASSEADRQAQAIIRQLDGDPERYARVIDAIERGKIGKLPAADREVAVALRSFNRGRARKLRTAGVAMGDVRRSATPGRAQDYIRHQSADPLDATGPLGKKARKRGQTQSIQKERTDPRPISVQNAEKPNNPLSTDLPTLQGVAINQGGRALETARVGRALLNTGKPVTRAPAAGETVVRIVGQKIERASGDDIDRLLNPKPKGKSAPPGQYRTVKADLLDDIEAKLDTGIETPGQLLRVPNKVTGAFKKLVYFSPAFQGRNAIGDTLLAYAETSPREIARGTRAGVKVLRHVSSGERKQVRKIGGKADDGGRTVKVGDEKLTLDEFANELMDQGVVRMNRAYEFEEMLRQGRVEPKVTKAAKVSEKAKGASVQRWLENREDLMRISTYKALRDRGVSKADAGNMVANVHIDYSELSKAERGVRATVAPFYTFAARQIPEQTKRLVTRPGKAANFEKARRNLEQATGGDQDELNEFEQRSVPFVIGLPGGDNRVIQFGAPQNLLNEAPQLNRLGGNLADALIAQGEEWSKFGVSQLGPFVRAPIEAVGGFSTFFRSEIEPEYAPLRPAPSWVTSLPPEMQRVLGVTSQYYDRKSGKTVPGWRGMAGYGLQQIPGLIAAGNKLATPGADKSKQTTAEKLIGFSGVQSRTSKTLENTISRLYDERAKVKKQAGALHQQLGTEGRKVMDIRKGPKRDQAIKALPPQQRDVITRYIEANAAAKDIETAIGGLGKELGYADPSFGDLVKPKKARKKKPSSGYGGGSSAPGYGGSSKAPGY